LDQRNGFQTRVQRERSFSGAFGNINRLLSSLEFNRERLFFAQNDFFFFWNFQNLRMLNGLDQSEAQSQINRYFKQPYLWGGLSLKFIFTLEESF